MDDNIISGCQTFSLNAEYFHRTQGVLLHGHDIVDKQLQLPASSEFIDVKFINSLHAAGGFRPVFIGDIKSDSVNGSVVPRMT